MKVKEESEKAGLNLNTQKTEIMASGSITSWQIDGEQWKQWETLFWGAPKSQEAWHAVIHGVAKSWTWLSDWTDWKSLQMVTTTMKLKDACSLEKR